MTDTVVLDVVYCEGWDADARAVVGRISRDAARRRDDLGEQYAVALTDPGSGRVAMLLEVAWRHSFARAWTMDADRRRTACAEYRRLPDSTLFKIHTTVWTYQDPEQPEFDQDRAGVVTKSYSRDGDCRQEGRPNGSRGGSSGRRYRVTVESLTRPAPAFGDWAVMLPRTVDFDLRDVPDPDEPPVEAPWRPSLPLRPRGVDQMFQPGTRYRLNGGEVVTETRSAGSVLLPTGSVVVADPGCLRELAPLPVTVEPGEYPVELAVVRFVDEPDHRRVAAARLVVADERVASWEMALGPDEDPLFLRDGEFHGFGVDSGMACFVDATSVAAMEAVVDESVDDLCGTDEGGVVLSDPATGANLVAFPSGWGDGGYPTWIGRSADGRVVAFVADMLVLHEAS